MRHTTFKNHIVTAPLGSLSSAAVITQVGSDASARTARNGTYAGAFQPQPPVTEKNATENVVDCMRLYVEACLSLKQYVNCVIFLCACHFLGVVDGVREEGTWCVCMVVMVVVGGGGGGGAPCLPPTANEAALAQYRDQRG